MQELRALASLNNLKLKPWIYIAHIVFIKIFKWKKHISFPKHHKKARLQQSHLYVIFLGNVFLLNLDVSVILAFLPLRLIDLADPDTWQLGNILVFFFQFT